MGIRLARNETATIIGMGDGRDSIRRCGAYPPARPARRAAVELRYLSQDGEARKAYPGAMGGTPDFAWNPALPRFPEPARFPLDGAEDGRGVQATPGREAVGGGVAVSRADGAAGLILAEESHMERRFAALVVFLRLEPTLITE